MQRHRLSFILVIGLVTGGLLTACGLFGEDPPRIEGVHEAEVQAGGRLHVFTVSISESDGRLSGIGDVQVRDSSEFEVLLTLSGRHEHPSVHLQLNAEASDSTFRLSGTASDDGDRIEGTLRFPEGRERSVVMRQLEGYEPPTIY